MSGEARELTLTEPASSLWRAVRGPLAALRQRYEEKPERWQMGGGSVLAARWKHRRSTDIDLITSAGWHLSGLRKTGNNGFTTELAKAGGKLDGYNEAALEMRFGKYQRLHIYGTEPTPRAGHERVPVDGEVFETLSTTQILAAKLLHRGLKAPARDLYDLVVAADRDPKGLAQAVNMLSPDTQADMTLMWHVRRDKIERDAKRNLMRLDADAPLLVKAEELVERAIRIVSDAGYDSIGVQPARPHTPATITTTDNAGRQQTIAVPRIRLEETLEGAGMNACLRARRMDRERFIESLRTEREVPLAPGGGDSLSNPPVPAAGAGSDRSSSTRNRTYER